MAGEKVKNIGHIQRKWISSVAWKQLDQLKIKFNVENNCETSLEIWIYCENTIAIAKELVTDFVS